MFGQSQSFGRRGRMSTEFRPNISVLWQVFDNTLNTLQFHTDTLLQLYNVKSCGALSYSALQRLWGQFNKQRLSSFLSLGGATLYYTFSARNCWQTAWKTSWLRQVTKAVSRYTRWVDQWRIQDEQKWRECKHGCARLTTVSDYGNISSLSK